MSDPYLRFQIELLNLSFKRFWSSQILGTRKQAQRWLREFTEGNYYLGGAVNPRNADMIAVDDGDDLIFNGDKFFSTGRCPLLLYEESS